jgi:hypothetical protein
VCSRGWPHDCARRRLETTLRSDARARARPSRLVMLAPRLTTLERHHAPSPLLPLAFTRAAAPLLSRARSTRSPSTCWKSTSPLDGARSARRTFVSTARRTASHARWTCAPSTRRARALSSTSSPHARAGKASTLPRPTSWWYARTRLERTLSTRTRHTHAAHALFFALVAHS